MPKPQIVMTIDKVATVVAAIADLANSRVMVGIPSERAGRPAKEGETISNAAIGYLMETGIPSQNVPARPHLVPGVKSVQQSSTIPRFEKAALAAFEGRHDASQKQLAAAGQEAADAVRKVIDTNIPPPLAEATVLGRLRRLKSYKRASRESKAQKRQEFLDAPEGHQALRDTGQLYRAYTYVIRKVTNNQTIKVGGRGAA